jgi:hypothetical protein
VNIVGLWQVGGGLLEITVNLLAAIHSLYVRMHGRFINTCRVVDVGAGEVYIFICNFWLADCLGEKTIVKTFKHATEQEQREAEYLFFTNVTE